MNQDFGDFHFFTIMIILQQVIRGPTPHKITFRIGDGSICACSLRTAVRMDPERTTIAS
jgi:hypothetical protein